MNRRTFLASLASGAAAVVLGVVGLAKRAKAADPDYGRGSCGDEMGELRPTMPKICPVCGKPDPKVLFIGNAYRRADGCIAGIRDLCYHGEGLIHFSELLES